MHHFFAGFEKVAKPKWAKMIASGSLSAESLKRLLPSIDKIREVEHLGAGSSQIADLVAHPKHGLVVRKTPLLELTAQKEKARKIKKALHMQKALQQAGKIDSPHIAKMVDRKGPIYYQEYVKPGKNEPASRISQLGDRLFGLTKTRDGNSVYRNSYNRLVRLAQRDIDRTNVIKDEGVLSAVKQIKEKVPGARDFTPRNVVGGKIVDFEPSGKPYSYTGIWTSDKRPPINKKDYSRREFFGKKT